MKRNKQVVAVAAVLLLITAALAVVHLGSRISVSEETLRIEAEGRVIELAITEMEAQDVQGIVINGKGEERTVDAQGVLLSQVLAQAGITQCTQVMVSADDEYSAMVTAEEIGAADRVFLLMEEGERPHLVVFGDSNSKRNVSGVIRLIVE